MPKFSPRFKYLAYRWVVSLFRVSHAAQCLETRLKRIDLLLSTVVIADPGLHLHVLVGDLQSLEASCCGNSGHKRIKWGIILKNHRNHRNHRNHMTSLGMTVRASTSGIMVKTMSIGPSLWSTSIASPWPRAALARCWVVKLGPIKYGCEMMTRKVKKTRESWPIQTETIFAIAISKTKVIWKICELLWDGKNRLLISTVVATNKRPKESQFKGLPLQPGRKS